MINSYKNVVRIKVLVEAFFKLKNKVVFVGGAVVKLYCDDPARGEIRPTEDVDVVVERANLGSYKTLEEDLRLIGLNPLCVVINMTILSLILCQQMNIF